MSIEYRPNGWLLADRTLQRTRRTICRAENQFRVFELEYVAIRLTC